MRKLADHRALITGASSGIGLEMARQLAAMGSDLVIAARRLDRLDALASELRATHGVEVTTVQADLSTAGAAAALWAAATRDGDLDICINNAGFGMYLPFTDISLERNLEMVTLNVTALVELSHRFATAAVGRDRRAYLLNIGSTAAFQPVPYFANYAATKHYVLAFSEALAAEVKGTNLSVTCLCPGGTWTEFFDHSGQKIGGLARPTMLPADRVAAIGLRAMLEGRRSVVSGKLNKIAAWFTRWVPRSTAAGMAVRALGKPRPQLPAASE